MLNRIAWKRKQNYIRHGNRVVLDAVSSLTMFCKIPIHVRSVPAGQLSGSYWYIQIFDRLLAASGKERRILNNKVRVMMMNDKDTT